MSVGPHYKYLLTLPLTFPSLTLPSALLTTQWDSAGGHNCILNCKLINFLYEWSLVETLRHRFVLLILWLNVKTLWLFNFRGNVWIDSFIPNHLLINCCLEMLFSNLNIKRWEMRPLVAYCAELTLLCSPRTVGLSQHWLVTSHLLSMDGHQEHTCILLQYPKNIVFSSKHPNILAYSWNSRTLVRVRRI